LAQETISYPGQSNRSHTSNFAYNMQSGLVDANITNINGSNWTANYSYKKDGNIEEKTVNSQSIDYEYDTTPGGSTVFDSDIMTKAGNEDLTWNENGQLVQKMRGSFEYNWDGKLRQAYVREDSISFKYDPMGNRVYKFSNMGSQIKTRRYIVDIAGGLPVILCEIDPTDSSLTKAYYYANAQILRQDNSKGSFYYVHDRLGSVRLVLNNVGDVNNTYTYNPFGEDLAAETTENPYKFTGQYYDSEINQYYLRARMYDPALMRFTGRDPVKGKYKEPLTLHQYLYCLNDPFNRIDPSGQSFADLLTSAYGFCIDAANAVASLSAKMWAFQKINFIGSTANGTLSAYLNAVTGPQDVSWEKKMAIGFTAGYMEYQISSKFGIGAGGAFAGAYTTTLNEAFSKDKFFSLRTAFRIGVNAGIGALGAIVDKNAAGDLNAFERVAFSVDRQFYGFFMETFMEMGMDYSSPGWSPP